MNTSEKLAILADAAKYDASCSNTIRRATFTPEEITDLTIDFYLRNYTEGLFLSSAVYASPDTTMADMVAVCRLLRKKHRFNGYIHLKVLPGASGELILTPRPPGPCAIWISFPWISTGPRMRSCCASPGSA